MIWKLSCGDIPMIVGRFIRVPQPPALLPGLILPVQGWALGRRLVISISNPICPIRYSLSLSVQWRKTWCAPRFAPPPTNYFSYHERGEGWHEMNEWEYELIWRGEIGKWRLLVGWNRLNRENPDIAHNCLFSDAETRTRDSNRDRWAI